MLNNRCEKIIISIKTSKRVVTIWKH